MSVRKRAKGTLSGALGALRRTRGRSEVVLFARSGWKWTRLCTTISKILRKHSITTCSHFVRMSSVAVAAILELCTVCAKSQTGQAAEQGDDAERAIPDADCEEAVIF